MFLWLFFVDIISAIDEIFTWDNKLIHSSFYGKISNFEKMESNLLFSKVTTKNPHKIIEENIEENMKMGSRYPKPF